MPALKNLCASLQKEASKLFLQCIESDMELTLETKPEHVYELLKLLQTHASFSMDMLMDIAGVDYSDYGAVEWSTSTCTASGYSRSVEKNNKPRRFDNPYENTRFAVVYHLLSVTLNHRIRVRVLIDNAVTPPIVPSVVELWSSANWFEREVFDLFGIYFSGHPDLRRILTDYGFVGHPFRKDFPLIGQVEARYDYKNRRVIYEKVSIEDRTLVPRVIRDDVPKDVQEA